MSDIKIINTSVGLPVRLRKAIEKKTGPRGVSRYLRELAAADLGKPELAEVRPEGRPKGATSGNRE